LRRRLGHLQTFGDRLQRPGIANENPQSLLGFRRGVIERLGMQHAGADILAL
jgi:hypothetical protein